MAKGKDKNHVSLGFWMFALMIMALPCIGTVMIIVWAFVGENETRKNFFRAMIAWFLILAVLWIVVILLGFWPQIQTQIQHWFHGRI